MEGAQMEAKLIATQPSNSLSPNYRGIETLPPLDVAFLIVITFVMFSGIAASIYAFIPKRKQHSIIFKPRYKFLCYRCRYFGDNPYLKCALHPVTVLTEQAVDCIDYDPNSEAKRIKK
jgi:hypothetical protein